MLLWLLWTAVQGEDGEKKQMIFIGLVGYAGSGKDTAFELIRKHINKEAERLAFADKLKDIADNMLEIADFERVAIAGNREKKEEIRPLLVWLGEYARKQNQDYWIDKIIPDIIYLNKAYCPMVIFTDVRYPNEAKYIIDHSGYLIRIESPSMPANSTEANSIAEIIRTYKDSPCFYSVYNAKENRAEFLKVLRPVIEAIEKDFSKYAEASKT